MPPEAPMINVFFMLADVASRKQQSTNHRTEQILLSFFASVRILSAMTHAAYTKTPMRLQALPLRATLLLLIRL